MIAKWISPESRPPNPSRMIEVVLEIPGDEKLEARARRLASEMDAKSPPAPTRIDGKTFWRVRRNPTNILQPVEAILAANHDHFYLVYAYAAGSSSCSEEIEGIQDSWQWTDVESPARHLEFRPAPMSAFDEKILLNFPAIANTFKTKNSQQSFGLSITNLKTKSFDLEVVVQIGELAAGDTLTAAAQRLGTGIQTQKNLAQPFVWHTVKGPHESVMTQPVPIPDPQRPFHMIWALVQLEGNQIVLLNFSLFTRDPVERSDYVVCAQSIVESITINNPPTR